MLDKGGHYGRDIYSSYYTGSSLGILGRNQKDDRIPPKEFVVGVTIDGLSKAYPFSALDQTPVVNDVFNRVPLLVTFDSSSATGVVFNPVVDGRRLNFQNFGPPGGFMMMDTETGTMWDPLTGTAKYGSLTGTTLEHVASHYEFWFSWKDYRPQTELYNADGPDGDSTP